MSDIETSMPSRADILSVIGGLEALRPNGEPKPPAPPTALGAAQARHDQDAAALRDMTADRDAWRTAAERMQTELWRQLDALRTELGQHRATNESLVAEVQRLRADRDAMGSELHRQRDQVAHLNAAMTSLLELANGRVAAPPGAAAAPAPAPAAPASAVAAPAAPRPVAAPAPDPANDPLGYVAPRGLGLPSTQPAPPPVDPNAPPMVIPSLAPDPRPPAKPKPRRPAAAARVVVPVEAAPEPAPAPELVEPVEPVELPPVVEFTAPEPDGARHGILPSAGPEKKRRLRLG